MALPCPSPWCRQPDSLRWLGPRGRSPRGRGSGEPWDLRLLSGGVLQAERTAGSVDSHRRWAVSRRAGFHEAGDLPVLEGGARPVSSRTLCITHSDAASDPFGPHASWALPRASRPAWVQPDPGQTPATSPGTQGCPAGPAFPAGVNTPGLTGAGTGRATSDNSQGQSRGLPGRGRRPAGERGLPDRWAAPWNAGSAAGPPGPRDSAGAPETAYSRGIHRGCTCLASTGHRPRGARHPRRCTRPC